MFWIGFAAAYLTGLVMTIVFLLIEEGMKTKRKKYMQMRLNSLEKMNMKSFQLNYMM